jgi:hypothetical protein
MSEKQNVNFLAPDGVPPYADGHGPPRQCKILLLDGQVIGTGTLKLEPGGIGWFEPDSKTLQRGGLAKAYAELVADLATQRHRLLDVSRAEGTWTVGTPFSELVRNHRYYFTLG